MKRYIQIYSSIIFMTCLLFGLTSLFINNFSNSHIYFLTKSVSFNQSNKTHNLVIEKKYISNVDFVNKKYTKKPIHLTFDDGPNLQTEKIINILKSYNVQGTFFFLENNIYKHPSIVNIVIENKNAVGCHGSSHKIEQFYRTPQNAVNEMRACKNAIYKTSRFSTDLIRVPYGSFPYLKQPIKLALEDKGFIYWDWNTDSADWYYRDTEQMLNNLISQVKNLEKDQIVPTVLFHDHHMTVQVLPSFLSWLIENGYSPEIISEAKEPLQFKKNANFKKSEFLNK